MAPELHIPIVIDIDQIEPFEWNPNEQDIATFNELVSSIEGEGFLEPVLVVPIADTDRYSLVGGEHRWKAAKLAGMEQITAVVKEGWDEDAEKIQNVRMNMTTGKMNPEKFASLWVPLEKKYGRVALMRLIGAEHKERELERLLGRVKKSMPKEMREDLDKRADKIRNVEDLATVVQSLYAQFGSTLDASYMFLTFGGKVHLMIKLDEPTKKELEFQLSKIKGAGGDANEVVKDALDAIMTGGGTDG